MEPSNKILVEWKNRRYRLDMSEFPTVRHLKYRLSEITGVMPDQLNLVNLKYKGEPVVDNFVLASLNLNPSFILIVQQIDESAAGSSTSEDVVGFKIFGQPRPNKKLLVLDIDNTIFDYDTPKNVVHTWAKRPSLHEFMCKVYKLYDIGIWSATAMHAIIKKVYTMSIHNDNIFKVLFYMDQTNMVFTDVPNAGCVKVKTLDAVWKIFPQYNNTNTILCDDLQENMLLNKPNGILVLPYFYTNHETDTELVMLGNYLQKLAESGDDFSSADHENWRESST